MIFGSWLRDIRVRVFAILLVALPVIIGLAVLLGQYYIEAMLPLYEWTLERALPDYRVTQMSLSHVNGEPVVAATVLAIREQVIDGRNLPAGFSVDVSTLAAHVYKHLVVIVLAVLIWPSLTFFKRLQLLVLSSCFLPGIEVLDIPLVLASAVRDLIVMNVAPESDAQSWLISWTRVMDGGWRMVFPIAAVFFAAQIQSLLFRGPQRIANV